MNRRIATALLAATLISGVCTYLLGKKLKVYAASQQRQMLRYVSPRHALEAGAVLQTADLDWTAWPLADSLPGAILRPEAAVGRVVLYPLAPGQPLLDRDLAAAGVGGGLGSKIPAGMRALALRSDEVVGVAGFLAPGSHLDVLVTYHGENASEAMTATVVQDAEVLAAGQQAEPDPSGKPSIATVVTLLLSPLDAERAVAASTQGVIHFVLRNALDHQAVLNAPVSLSWLSPPALHVPAAPLPGFNPVPSRTSAPRYRDQPVGDGVETVFGASGGSKDESDKADGPGIGAASMAARVGGMAGRSQP